MALISHFLLCFLQIFPFKILHVSSNFAHTIINKISVISYPLYNSYLVNIYGGEIMARSMKTTKTSRKSECGRDSSKRSTSTKSTSKRSECGRDGSKCSSKTSRTSNTKNCN